MTMERIVLLPGLLCDAAVWTAQRDALAARAQTFVAEYHDLDSLEEMAAKVLRDAPFDRFSLAGHSMGGRVAMEIMRTAPHRVERLALMDTGYEPLAEGDTGLQEKARRYQLLDQARQHGMREMGKLWAPGMVHPERHASPLFEEILDMIERRTVEQFQGQITALLGRPDTSSVLETLQCPTWFICGRQDVWSPVERHEVMAQMVAEPYVQLKVVEDSGHMVTMEQPSAVSALLDAWLDTASAQTT